jgi:hypothetical protein
MKLWMIAINIASSEELDEIDANAKKEVLEGKSSVLLLILLLKNKRTSFLIGKIANSSNQKEAILNYASSLSGVKSDKKRNNCST